MWATCCNLYVDFNGLLSFPTQGRGIQRAHTIGGGASFGLSPSGADHVGGDRDLDLSFNAQVNIPADSPTATVDSS